LNATGSGLRTLPMAGAILITSIGSGILVARTGRYKIFPVLGAALLAIAFLLLSTMSVSTPMGLQTLYIVILGAGIGMSTQILILIVQNTSNFADLGVATSAVTFCRAIGSMFGAAIFGALFISFLAKRTGPALAASGAPEQAMSSPTVLHQLPREMAAPIVGAYNGSLTEVFLCVAGVAAVGFIVALLLREVPVKDIPTKAPDPDEFADD
jgi:hypothetical protein